MFASSSSKLYDQIFDLRFTSKQLVRASKKAENEAKKEKLNVKRAIEKNNQEGAKIYAQNVIRKNAEALNFLRLSSRLDAVVARLESQSRMQGIIGSMGSIVKSLDRAMKSGDMEKVAETMDKFEKQFESLDVKSEFVEGAMSKQAALSTPEDAVNQLVQQVAEEHGLELQNEMPLAGRNDVGQAERQQTDQLGQTLTGLRGR